MERRPLTEGGIESRRVHSGDPRGVQVSQATLELSRATEGLLDSHLLIERKSDQEGERFIDEQSIGYRVTGERQGVYWHAGMVPNRAYLELNVGQPPRTEAAVSDSLPTTER